MSNFVFLTAMGLIAFVVLRWVLEKVCDNSTTLDLDKERELTEQVK